jgi:predicted metal-dependent hydrolase
MSESTPLVPAGEEVELLFALARRRYGHRLASAELDGLREAITAIVEDARALRAVPLRDADEPAPPFAPLRAEP